MSSRMQISVGVCIFSGLMEVFPTCTEKVQKVDRYLLKKIIPWFGIPVSIRSDNETAFVTEVLQLMAKGLGITWKLHTAYHPQSSGKVECLNRT
jgi:transposase InsO family protein